MKTPIITVQPQMIVPVIPVADWPKFEPSAKPSRQSPYKTVLQFGEKGATQTVRIIVEGRSQEQVDAYARQITGTP